jgi:hypothetical protein
MTVDQPGTNTEQLTGAWTEFTDQLRVMGLDALASAPTDADRVDGLRFLLRQLAYREEQTIEFPAVEQPEIFLPESPTRKVFADCPDTIYRQINVSPDHTYRITGSRGDGAYISFTSYRAAATDRVVADLHDGEIEIGVDGSVDLTVGGPARPTNWLDLGDDGAFVVIREYRHDRAGGDPARFEVEQTSPAPSHRPEPTAEDLTDALDAIGTGLFWANAATVRLSEELRLRPNRMDEAAAELVSEMAGTPHNHYQLCYVQLAPGQALELELDPPSCRYWSVHLNNWWLESPEFRDGQSVCINDAQARREPDGTIKMVVAPEHPGHDNWLDTKGRSETVLLARYLLPEGALPPIVTRVIDP